MIRREYCPDCDTRLAFTVEQTDTGGSFMQAKCDCGFEWKSTEVYETPIKAVVKGYEELWGYADLIRQREEYDRRTRDAD